MALQNVGMIVFFLFAFMLGLISMNPEITLLVKLTVVIFILITAYFAVKNEGLLPKKKDAESIIKHLATIALGVLVIFYGIVIVNQLINSSFISPYPITDLNNWIMLIAGIGAIFALWGVAKK